MTFRLAYPYRYHPTTIFDACWSTDYAASNPAFIVASCAAATNFDPLHSGYSLDGGYTWTAFPAMPLGASGSQSALNTFGAGCIAAASDTALLWTSQGSKGTCYSTDRGASWSRITLPGGVSDTAVNAAAYFVVRRPICADKATAGIFYAFVLNNGFYRSTDSGATWARMVDNTPFVAPAGYANDWNFHVTLKAVPGNAGHLFLSTGPATSGGAYVTNSSFMRSTDGGATWARLPAVRSVHSVGFGKAAPGQSYPAIYIAGYVSGVFGIYRSIDNAATWALLAVDPGGSLDFIGRAIDGDKDVYGRVYLTCDGSGALVGNID